MVQHILVLPELVMIPLPGAAPGALPSSGQAVESGCAINTPIAGTAKDSGNQWLTLKR